jgi:hypothetical protein
LFLYSCSADSNDSEADLEQVEFQKVGRKLGPSGLVWGANDADLRLGEGSIDRDNFADAERKFKKRYSIVIHALANKARQTLLSADLDL